MITCSNCGALHIECDAKAYGVQLHTKIEKDNTVLIVPEYFRVEDSGNKPKISCQCKDTSLQFYCDYCNTKIRAKTIHIVTESNKKKMIACGGHARDLEERYEIEKVKISSLKIVPVAN